MIKAMTLTQPWASRVASGIKLIENRPWRAPRSMVGEQFAIHASRSYDLATLRDLFIDKLYGDDVVSPYSTSRDFPLSAIIGVATLDRVEHAVGEFTGADLDALGIRATSIGGSSVRTGSCCATCARWRRSRARGRCRSGASAMTSRPSYAHSSGRWRHDRAVQSRQDALRHVR